MARTRSTVESNRAKIGYLNYEDMLLKLQSGEIDSYDIVYSKDKKITYFISPNLEPIEMKSRVYVFKSVDEANVTLNENTDTYEGQIVSILEDEKYKGYIVNKDAKTNEYYVSPLHELDIVDYNTLGNKPIINMVGTFTDPIEIASLEPGIYSVTGQYKILNSEETIYLSTSPVIFIVENDKETVTIKKITSYEIIDYVIINGEITTNKVTTESFLKDNGYCTEEYVNKKLEALDILTKAETEKYINEVIEKIIDETLDAKIDAALEEKIQDIEDTEINELF